MRPILQQLQPTHPRALTLGAALLVTLAGCIGIVSSPTAAHASPLAEKQAVARALDAQVRRLEHEYDELQERYRGALYELEEANRDVDRAAASVAGTQRNLGRAQVRLRSRVITIYTSGGSGNELVDLAVAGSFSGLFDRIDAVRRVGSQDATVLDDVRRLNARMVKRERQLKQVRARQRAIVQRAQRDKSRMGGLVAERQRRLDSVNGEIRAIMEAQRRAAERLAAQRARESAARAAASVATAPAAASASAQPEASSDSGSSGLSVPIPPGSGAAASAASIAMGKIGTPYVWGGSGPNSFDCSGLVMWAFAQAGRPGLPHSTYSLVNMGVNVPLDQLQVGDLVFPSHNGHVGIYVGGGSFVHAPRTGDVVKVTSMSSYSISHARRL